MMLNSESPSVFGKGILKRVITPVCLEGDGEALNISDEAIDAQIAESLDGDLIELLIIARGQHGSGSNSS